MAQANVQAAAGGAKRKDNSTDSAAGSLSVVREFRETSQIKITVLGSGTSSGVPTIGCDCKVCTSPDPRDKRLRPSILVQYGGHNVVIDTTPDFRQQALRAGLRRLDAILYTHAHADHIMGLDDVRPFNFMQRERIPIYASAEALETIQSCFRYVFETRDSESSLPKIETHIFESEPIQLSGLAFDPLRLHHGRGTSYGFRFGRCAYLTDHSDIPEETVARMQGLDVLFLDALRHKPHPTHTTVERAVEWVDRLKPKRAFLTHMSHDLMHVRTEDLLPPHVRLAYDGLEITLEERC
jgi:phosphoribosyl 1,2-cyclic phosphate phosphodiesterase